MQEMRQMAETVKTGLIYHGYLIKIIRTTETEVTVGAFIEDVLVRERGQRLQFADGAEITQ